jgi:uncharacterized membrane protein
MRTLAQASPCTRASLVMHTLGRSHFGTYTLKYAGTTSGSFLKKASISRHGRLHRSVVYFVVVYCIEFALISLFSSLIAAASTLQQSLILLCHKLPQCSDTSRNVDLLLVLRTRAVALTMNCDPLPPRPHQPAPARTSPQTTSY